MRKYSISPNTSRPGFVSIDDKFLGWWERPSIKPNEYEEYTIESEFDRRPDLLSFKIYGTVARVPSILLLNNIVDPYNEFRTGRKIVLEQ